MDIVDLAKEISVLNSSETIKTSLVHDIHRCVYAGVVINNYYTRKNLTPINPWAIHTLDVPALADLCVWANEQPVNNKDIYLTTRRTVGFQIRQSVTEVVVNDIIKHRFFVEWERHRQLQRGCAKQIMTGKHFPTLEWLFTTFSKAEPHANIRIDDQPYEIQNKQQLNQVLTTLMKNYLSDTPTRIALFAKYPDASKLLGGHPNESNPDTINIATLLTLLGHNVVVTVGLIN